MKQPDLTSSRRKGLWATLAIAAIAGACAVTVALPTIPARAGPESPTPDTTAEQPADTDAAEPEAGRVNDVADGFSYIVPAGWVESDASHLEYGSALLSKESGAPTMPGQQTPVANDTRIVLGKLDQRLYASAEADNTKAAARLGSDMGEFFMPYPGTRINQETIPLAADNLTGSASYYEVKFTDTTKPVGQIWTGVIGTPATGTAAAQRWFVVWLGTANNPVDKVAAKTLAESIRPLAAASPAPTNNQSPAPTNNQSPAPTNNQSPAPTNNQSPAPTNNQSPAPTNQNPAPEGTAPAAGQQPSDAGTPA